MKIYTKTGDQGETGLLGGIRVSKSHPTIAVTGELDELNSWIGVARSLCGSEAHQPLQSVDHLLTEIQHELFDLGSRVAACMTESNRAAEFPATRIDRLEKAIDGFEEELPALTAFILPSGAQAGCTIHLARAVCRRAERELVRLIVVLEESGKSPKLSHEQVYLNRLSDLLFVLARYVNRQLEQPETEWQSQ